MILEELEKNWQMFAEADALWSILTHPEKQNGKWELKEFLNTGNLEVDKLMDEIDRSNLLGSHHGVLDFGCGVGRLSQAFARHFERVDGLDIAQSMIDFANRINQFPDSCHYHTNPANSLSIFEDNRFDLIYSNIVLQHMSPIYAKEYLREFFRITKQGGLVVFQLPSHKKFELRLAKRRSYLPWFKSFFVRTRFYEYKVKTGDAVAVMEMNGVARSELIKFLHEVGFVIHKVRRDFSTGSNWISYQYWLMKV